MNLKVKRWFWGMLSINPILSEFMVVSSRLYPQLRNDDGWEGKSIKANTHVRQWWFILVKKKVFWKVLCPQWSPTGGLEPPTTGLKGQRSTDWARQAHLLHQMLYIESCLHRNTSKIYICSKKERSWFRWIKEVLWSTKCQEEEFLASQTLLAEHEEYKKKNQALQATLEVLMKSCADLTEQLHQKEERC